MLPGREGVVARRVACAALYALPLKYAEGEEMLRGAAGADGRRARRVLGRQLLDRGRLAPDGSQFNAVRLHHVAMQSAAADRRRR